MTNFLTLEELPEGGSINSLDGVTRGTGNEIRESFQSWKLETERLVGVRSLGGIRSGNSKWRISNERSHTHTHIYPKIKKKRNIDFLSKEIVFLRAKLFRNQFEK